MQRPPRAIASIVFALALAGCGARSDLTGPRLDVGPRDAPPPDVAYPDVHRLDAPPPDLPLPERGLIIRACVIAATCVALTADEPEARATFPVGACLDWFARRDFPTAGPSPAVDPRMLGLLRNCSAVTRCDQFLACIGGSWITGGSCFPEAVCEGDRVVPFDPAPDPERAFDCQTIGASCVMPPVSALMACCRHIACDEFGPYTQCAADGVHGEHCMLGIGWPFDCGPSGRVCQPDPDEGEVCAGASDKKCLVGTPTDCDFSGHRASYCSGGFWADYDCRDSLFRTRCAPESPLPIPCRPAGTECTPEDPGICLGMNLGVCVDGRWEPFDCTQIGYEVCYAANESRPAICGFLL